MKNPIYTLTLFMIFAVTVDYRFLSGIEGFPSITVAEGLTYLAALLLAGQLALEREELSRRMAAVYRENRPVFWYFLWAGLASLASLVRSPDALRYYKDLVPSLMVYVLVSVCVVGKKEVKGSLVALLSGTAINLILGISQALTGAPRIVDLRGSGSYKMDFWGELAGLNISTGFLLHPNGYAIFLLPMIILLVGLLMQKRASRRIPKAFLALMLLLAAYNLLSTYAKGVIVWAVIGIGLLLIVKRIGRSRTAVGMLILLACIAGITTYGIGALGSSGKPNGTMLTRYQLWQAGLWVILNDSFVLFMGNGFEAMMSSSQQFSNLIYPNAHNTYINQVIYFGLPALLLYLALAGKALRRISRIVHNDDESQGTAARVLFSTLIALLGIYFFEPAIDGVVLQAQFFLVLAFTNVVMRLEEGKSGNCREYQEEDRYLQNSISTGL